MQSPSASRSPRARTPSRRRTSLAAALAGLLAGFLVSAPLAAIETTLYLPKDGDHRIDICLHWGSQCAGEAARVYCQVGGFDDVSAWEVDHDIGAEQPTVILGSGQTCSEAHCDAYASITCVRESEWTRSTGLGGLLVVVHREPPIADGQQVISLDPPAGALLVAVNEETPTQAISALLDREGTALLPAPPGRYALLLVDWHNPLRLERAHRSSVTVLPGRDGFYFEWFLD